MEDRKGLLEGFMLSGRAVKATESAKLIRGITKDMSRRAHEAAAEGKPVAYSFMGGPHGELLRAMDIVPVWTENYAAICAAKRQADAFITKAEVEGYPRNLCSYCTPILGIDAMRKELGATPDSADGGLEKPTMMLGSGMMICDPRYKAYQAVQRYTDVPYHVIDWLWPPVTTKLEDVQDYYLKYMKDQLWDLVGFLEKQTGKQMNWDKLSEIVDLSERTIQVWHDAFQFRKAIPAPMPAEDAMNTMVPGWFLLGTQESLDFFKNLYQELKERVEKKIGVVQNERFRLMWAAGLPPWYALAMFNYLEAMGAVTAIEVTYHPPDPVEIPSDITHPLDRIAWRNFNQFSSMMGTSDGGVGDPMVNRLLKMCDEYTIDGLLMHRAMTCRTVHVGEIHMANVLKEYTTRPVLILEGDIVDMSAFDEAGAQAKLDGFMEVLESSAQRRK